MNISFPNNEPLDTVIHNSADNRPLYEIKTPWAVTNRTTSIRRIDPKGYTHLIAEIHWHKIGSTTVTVLGTSMDMDQFLRKESMWSSSKTMTGIDGRLYKWKHESSAFTLVDCQTNAVVAQSHRKKGGLFSAAQNMNVDIFPQGMQNLDIVVVSFIIMEEKQRQTSRGSSAAVAVSAGA